MVNPKIVYCNKKHIYDAALDKECPYCKKIEEEHKRLSKIVRGSKLTDENKNEEHTELIKSISGGIVPDVWSEESGEYTELIARRGSEEGEEYTELITSRVSEEEEYTELIDSRGSGVIYEQDMYEIIKLQGWLVCVSGGDSGKSFELSAGDNFVYKEKGNKISVSSKAKDNKRLLGLLGLLCYQEESGEFVIESHTNSECIVDGTQVTNECILKSYSHIRWEQMEFVFVKFCKDRL